MIGSAYQNTKPINISNNTNKNDSNVKKKKKRF